MANSSLHMSMVWPSAVVALLATNAATIYWIYTRRWNRGSNALNGQHVAPLNLPESNEPMDTNQQDDQLVASTDGPITEVANSPLALDSSIATFHSYHNIPTDAKSAPHRVERTVYCMDTNAYLQSIALPVKLNGVPIATLVSHTAASPASTTGDAKNSWSDCSVITSVPDVSETGLSLPKWRNWFLHVCVRILERIHLDQVAIFYQTDIRCDGEWVSKAHMVMQAAEKRNMKVAWHKVVIVNSLDTVRGSTSGYVHLICVAHRGIGSHVENPACLTPDIISHRGTMLWKRAMGLRACEAAVKYIKLQVNTCHTIVDPFCGSGSILAMANKFGLSSTGVDHARKRCQQANELNLDKLEDFGGPDSEREQQLELNKKNESRERKAQRRESGRTQKEQQMWERDQKRIERERNSTSASVLPHCSTYASSRSHTLNV